MPVSPARAAAFDILLRVEREDAYASELLHSSRHAKLSPADHGLATELVMGVLRWRSLLDESIAAQSTQRLEKLDLEVLTALRLAAYQISFLDRVPHRAAVHESVELVKRARKRSATAFVNAVLRKFPEKTEPSATLRHIENTKTTSELAQTSAHPLWLVERWAGEFGFEAARKICGHDQHPPETAIRVSDPAFSEELKQEGIELAPGKLLASARTVIAGDITKTRAFREGRLAIQDEASQLVALLAGRGQNILDCCAAPGGKTRVLAERNPEAKIVAVELYQHRARLLKKLAPANNIQVVCADIREFSMAEPYDLVLADVPCSGTGTLARNPEIKWRLKLEDLLDLQSRQTTILLAAMKQVALGGRLVYSTCSLERGENADVVEKALATDISFRLLDCRAELERLHSDGELVWNSSDSLTSGNFLRTLPGIHPCDGFFAAILQRS